MEERRVGDRRADCRISPAISEYMAVQECGRLRAALERIFADNGLNSENRAQALEALHGKEMTDGFGAALAVTREIVSDENVDLRFREILAGQPLSAYGRTDHEMTTDGRPLKEGT